MAERTYNLRIRRCDGSGGDSYWQDFAIEGRDDDSVAALLKRLNDRSSLVDAEGNEAEPVGWECSCMLRKCGACAMRINGRPALACSTFPGEWDVKKGGDIVLEPLSKFPVVRDLIVDRSAIFKNLKRLSLWLEEKSDPAIETGKQRYRSAKCLMCGCCLEVCPNFSVDGSFSGAVAAVNGFRVFEEESSASHREEVRKRYDKLYFSGCGKSLSCHDICPVELPVEELIVRSNAAAVWRRGKKRAR